MPRVQTVKARGRQITAMAPRKKIEKPFRTNIILSFDMTDYLDRVCIDIRTKHEKHVERSGLIRALLEGVQRAGLDLSLFGTEAEIADEIASRLKLRSASRAEKKNPGR